jgi:CHAT domain-containing protein
MQTRYRLGIALAIAVLPAQIPAAETAACEQRVPATCGACRPPVQRPACTANATLDAARSALDAGRYCEAATLAQCVASPAARGEALLVLGQAQTRLGCYPQAGRALERALGAAGRDPTASARALTALGDLYERQKEHARARQHYTRALRRLRPGRDWRDAMSVWFQLGDIEVASGEFESGIAAYERALRAARTPQSRAQALDYLGYAYRRLGDFDKAVYYHESALYQAALIQDEGSRASAQGRAHNHLGLSLQAMALAAAERDAADARRLLRDALDHEQRAAAVARAPTLERRRLGYVLRASATMWLQRAQLEPEQRAAHLEQGRQAAQAALDLGREMGDREWEGLALNQLGIVQAQLGDLHAAQDTLESALAIWRCIGDRLALAGAYRALAQQVKERAGQYAAAREYYARALESLEPIRAHDDLAQLHYLIGGVHERAGEPEQAKAAYLRAIERLESVRAKLRSDQNKLAYFGQRLDPYEALIALLVRSYGSSAAPADAERAFGVSEQARGRAMLDLLGPGAEQLRARVDAESLARERALQSALDATLDALQSAARDPAALVPLQRELQAHQRRLDAFYAALAPRYPEYVRLKRPQPLPLAELRERALAPGQVLVEYFVGELDSYAFVVHRDGLRAVLPLGAGREELVRQVRALREPFARIQPDLDGAGIAAALAAFDPDLAHALYRRLFAPLVPHLAGARSLVIVPHGPLFHLPFELLVQQPGKPQGDIYRRMQATTFLLESAPPLTYAISATLLRAQPPAQEGARLLALVGPVTARAPLRSADLEARELTRVYGRRAAVHTGRDASKARFLAEAGKYGAIYLATHGEYDEQRPMASGFWLNDPQDARGALVSAREVFDLSLPARLVAIRACQAGLGRIQDGEGIVGLARALKYAGAQRLVLSLWMVDDESPARLMLDFHAALARADTPQALRGAKLALRRSQRYWAHPFYWAPFVVMA